MQDTIYLESSDKAQAQIDREKAKKMLIEQEKELCTLDFENDEVI